MALPPKFSEGEKLFCFYGPLIYEAKCLKSYIMKDKHVRYFIHYIGWNKKWDEWVPESRLLKYTEANLERQKEAQKTHSAQFAKNIKSPAKDRKATASSTTYAPFNQEEPRPSTSAGKQLEILAPVKAVGKQIKERNQPTKKKRGGLAESEHSQDPDKPEVIVKQELEIEIPDELQEWMVDDWDIVKKQLKLVILPAKLNVEQIFDNYLALKKRTKAQNQLKESVLVDVTNGLIEMFNVFLPGRLLYLSERPQYNDTCDAYPGTPMSKLYGSIHLLRLIVKFGPSLQYAVTNDNDLQLVLFVIQDFLKYMVDCRILFSLRDYFQPNAEYHRRVE